MTHESTKGEMADVLFEKFLYPEKAVICPICGEEIEYEEYGTSVIVIICKKCDVGTTPYLTYGKKDPESLS